MSDSLIRFKKPCDRCHTDVCNGTACDGDGVYYDIDGIRVYVDLLKEQIWELSEDIKALNGDG
jgi:hypothetical protein